MGWLRVNTVRLAFIPAVLALWPAWWRQAQYGWQGFPFGLFMFTALVGWFVRAQRDVSERRVGSRGYLYAAWGLLALYIVGYDILPPLGRNIVAVEVLACLMLAAFPQWKAEKLVALLALFPLSLPLEMALQYVLGYPFRRFTATVAGWLLTPYGTATQGTTLLYDNIPLEVDAACSGVIGLWFFLIAGALLSLLLRHRWLGLIATLAAATVASLLYNIARTAMLFQYRFHVGIESDFVHELLGVVAFFAVLVPFGLLISRSSRRAARVRRLGAV